jgi:hypothetical protein
MQRILLLHLDNEHLEKVAPTQLIPRRHGISHLATRHCRFQRCDCHEMPPFLPVSTRSPVSSSKKINASVFELRAPDNRLTIRFDPWGAHLCALRPAASLPVAGEVMVLPVRRGCILVHRHLKAFQVQVVLGEVLAQVSQV